MNFKSHLLGFAVVLLSALASHGQTPAPDPLVVQTDDGRCEIKIDTTEAAELKEWADTKLAPALQTWYPKIVAMLPSDGFVAPTNFSVTIRPGRGVAATGGAHITANSRWIQSQLEGEALGSIIHEAVHVVQNYGEGRREHPDAERFPGWLTEGIADYIRWFQYEPQSHGADDVWLKRQNFSRLRYDGAYRQTANFLNWVSEKYDSNIVMKLNASARLGTYGDSIWTANTGKSAAELGNEWKIAKAKQFGIELSAAVADSDQAGEIRVAINRNEDGDARFEFRRVPSPVRDDAATHATLKLISGEADRNGGGLERLNDDKLPSEADQPSANFFFAAGTDGGRILMTLDHSIAIKQINTFSWHPDTRAAQVYKLYASDGSAAGFEAAPARGTDPGSSGWTLLASVNSRRENSEPGGQYGVSISREDGNLGKFRYLLWDCSPTETNDTFGNTFYSEVDVIEAGATPHKIEVATVPRIRNTVTTADGKYEFTFDTSVAPDLTDWAKTKLAPVVEDWYPKMIALLPSDGFEAPTRVTIQFRENMPSGIPAMTGGAHVSLNVGWFRGNLEGEAKGAVIHELVHVIQRYHRPDRDSGGARFPGWLVEGIPDYIRWFKYEPQSHGADDVWLKRRDVSRLHYNDSYRTTANFLNWVAEKYDPNLVAQLNAAGRAGTYNEDLWKKLTGKTAEELNSEWLAHFEQKTAAAIP